MRLTGKILLPLVLAAGVWTMGASPALAAPTGRYHPQLGVSTQRWNPGSSLKLAGSGFASGESVSIDLSTHLATVSSDSTGVFDTAVTVPWMPIGEHLLTATGLQSGGVASYIFDVQAFNPWAEPSSYWTPAGSTLQFSGHRFANDETVDVSVDGPGGSTIVATAVADVLGELAGQGHYVVPLSDANQTLHFTMTGRTSHATAMFTSSIGPPTPGGEVGPPPVQETPPTLVTAGLVPMLPGQRLWQSVQWLGDDQHDACNFEVTATSSAGTTASYPAGQTFSQPYKQATLHSGDTDFTALFVTVPNSLTSSDSLTLQVSYRRCGAGISTDEPVSHLTLHEALPIAPNTGAPFDQNNTSVDVPSGQTTWVKVYFTGNSPDLPNFHVQVTDSAGAVIAYPAGQTYTTLSKVSTLGVGVKDYVSFRVDPAMLGTGIYVLKLNVSFGPPTTAVPTTVALNVT